MQTFLLEPREHELVDGVPFLVVQGYSLGGKAESASDYLSYCVSECAWRQEEFKPRTALEKQKALDKLLTSPKWKAGLSEDEKQFLSSQIK